MKKYSAKTVFNVLLIVAAYGYLIYTFVTFDDYPELFGHFRSAGWPQYGALALAAALIPLNFLCEAFKWQYLLRKLEPMTLLEAQRQVYYGFLGAMLTPERLGDYPTRVTRIPDKTKWLPAIALGFVGTMGLSTVNMSGGLLSLLFSGLEVGGAAKEEVLTISCLLLVFFVAVLLLLPYWARKTYKPNRPNLAHGEADRPEQSVGKNKSGWRGTWQKMVEVLKDFSFWEFPVVIAISFLRYLTYGTQLLLVLVFCGVTLTPLQYLIIIPIHYLFVTVVPTVPVADAAVRGSVGVLIFSAFTNNTAGVALAAIVLWILNTIIPAIIGTTVKQRE